MVDKKGEPTLEEKAQAEAGKIGNFFKAGQQYTTVLIEEIYKRIEEGPIYAAVTVGSEKIKEINNLAAEQIANDGTGESFRGALEQVTRKKGEEYK